MSGRQATERFAGYALPALFALLFASTWLTPSKPAEGRAAADVRLVPFVIDTVRERVPVACQVLVVNDTPREESVQLSSLRVSVDGQLLVEQPLSAELQADPEYAAVQRVLELLPHEVSHLHRETRYFAGDDEPEFAGEEAFDQLQDVRRRIHAMRERNASDDNWPCVQPGFEIPLDMLFFEDDPRGTERTLLIEVDYAVAGGPTRTARVTDRLEYRGKQRGLPQSYVSAQQGAVSVHAGDLHVHSCHGEAAGACAPSANCTAETLQLSGSFSYAQLKSQYQALGYDWFAATDHSYCINSTAEFQTIQSEISAINDANFVAFADIELSSDEVGSQEGSDSGNLLCIGTTSANHMGAHDITSRIEGGEDGLLGFCDGLFSDVLDNFQNNANAVRAQGGFPIIHHPDGGNFGWNSNAATQGIEAGQLHGVEIWNGGFQSGQGGHVGDWVNWLLGGRLLYAYSGSDTHDEAFEFGANHVVLSGAFSPANVMNAARDGQLYISNGPSLVIEAIVGAQSIPMGMLQNLPTTFPTTPITVRAHYDFGADTGTVSIYGGVSGGGSENQLLNSPGLTGSGFVDVSTNLNNVQSWYRAYAQNNANTETAYTNPVFFVPGTGNVFNYCTANEHSFGCSATIVGSGTPSATAGSGFDIGATNVPSNQNGLMIYGYGGRFLPFGPGTLCITAPIVRTLIQNSGGNGGPTDCSGTYSYDFNTHIATSGDLLLQAGNSATAQYWYRDPGSPAAFGLTDALQILIQP